MAKQTVPLVLYQDGARTEIGEAEVDLETGLVTAMIHGDASGRIPDIASVILKGTVGPMSFDTSRNEVEIKVEEG